MLPNTNMVPTQTCGENDGCTPPSIRVGTHL